MTIDSDRGPAPEFQFDVAGIGMSVLDSLQIVEEWSSSEGVTEVVEHKIQGGGPVSTAIVTAAKLGARTAIVDRIGADWRGDLVAREYREAGVNTSALVLEPEKTTTFGMVLVRKRDCARHIVFAPGDFTPLRTDELPMETIRSARILHLNGRHWPACIAAAQAVNFHQPAFEISPVVDTTGCGDVFHGAFLFAHSRGWTVRECASFASAAAAINATALGGRGRIPDVSQIRELIRGRAIVIA